MSCIIHGCKLTFLDAKSCFGWIEQILGQKPCGQVGGWRWAIAHCEDGVTWGHLTGGEWRLGSDVFPDSCPRPEPSKLLELRVFSKQEEVLIWRVQGRGGLLAGRLVRDDEDSPSAVKPADEDRLLLGSEIFEQAEGFARVGDGSGNEQVFPLTSLDPRPRLRVRHYFSTTENGIVRVVLSRLVEVF